MSSTQSFMYKYGVILFISCFVGGFGSVFAVLIHDSNIDREEITYRIHSDDSCEELLQALEYEDRKIMKDLPQYKNLKHFIVEKRC